MNRERREPVTMTMPKSLWQLIKRTAQERRISASMLVTIVMQSAIENQEIVDDALNEAAS